MIDQESDIYVSTYDEGMTSYSNEASTRQVIPQLMLLRCQLLIAAHLKRTDFTAYFHLRDTNCCATHHSAVELKSCANKFTCVSVEVRCYAVSIWTPRLVACFHLVSGGPACWPVLLQVSIGGISSSRGHSSTLTASPYALASTIW